MLTNYVAGPDERPHDRFNFMAIFGSECSISNHES